MDSKKNKEVIDLLPLGTVVTIQGFRQKIMITKYYDKIPQISYDPENITYKIYDYMGVSWPEGDTDLESRLSFNHEIIDNIYFYGYTNEESLMYLKSLKDKKSNNTEKEV